ncbi:NUDIX hydrolase [Mycolicibacterium arseniciresistens]|uniref:NUDIX hydrolase n=1 Tax=Mycolicibacterium arseniciresistens TaxID=3062257 RepID=A0ABT8U9H5_9MYCO|nr:NUDIX domain-containing protein [Mycolicibacterium arseniciresistens]MDO3634446.1 NUDIX hydrolase [Mycolicibacterium arseniciresistens]
MFRDGSGRTLADYPRPSVAVDTALLTLDRSLGLVVLEVRRPTGRGWALPGTFLHEHERLADAVNRSLWDKAHIRGLRPRQLQVFDAPGRDDRGWVLSVAHIQVVHASRLEDRFHDSTRLVPVTQPGRLPFDHAEIAKSAVHNIRSRYSDEPDPDHLLGDSFTLRELRLAHEAVMGRELQRDTFRRTMEPRLVATGETTAGGRGRPAEVFRRAAAES